MDILFTPTTQTKQVLSKISSTSQQIKTLQDYCRAFTCVKSKGQGTITIWLN